MNVKLNSTDKEYGGTDEIPDLTLTNNEEESIYSLEDRLRAVKLYFDLGQNTAPTVRKLGYADV